MTRSLPITLFTLLTATCAAWQTHRLNPTTLRGHGWPGPTPPPTPTLPFGPDGRPSYTPGEDFLSTKLPTSTPLGPTFRAAITQLAATEHRRPIQIQFDTAALARAGISPDTPVHLNAGGLPRGDAMLQLLATADPARLEAGYHFEHDALQISTRQELEYAPVYAYDVSDLLASPDPASPAYRRSVNALIQRIETEVSPTSWKDHGGQTGDAHPDGPQLFITQSESAHTQIAYTLEHLRWRTALTQHLRRIAFTAAIAGIIAFTLASAIARRLLPHRRLEAFPIAPAQPSKPPPIRPVY